MPRPDLLREAARDRRARAMKAETPARAALLFEVAELLEQEASAIEHLEMLRLAANKRRPG